MKRDHASCEDFSVKPHLIQKVRKELIIETGCEIWTFSSFRDPKSAFMTVVSVKMAMISWSVRWGPGSEKFSVPSTIWTFIELLTLTKFDPAVCAITHNQKTIQNITIHAWYSAKASYEHVFEMALASSITRSHRFHYADCEILSAIFDETIASNLRCDPKVFTQLLDHFYHSPEICIEASQNFFHVKSFHQDSADVAFHSGSKKVSCSHHLKVRYCIWFPHTIVLL